MDSTSPEQCGFSAQDAKSHYYYHQAVPGELLKRKSCVREKPGVITFAEMVKNAAFNLNGRHVNAQELAADVKLSFSNMRQALSRVSRFVQQLLGRCLQIQAPAE